MDLVSKLDGLEDGPEGEQVILELWKILFPKVNVHIQRENGKCRYLDDVGGEYFLATSYYSEIADCGVFFGKYVTEAEPLYGDTPLDWGFPPTATWIPKELFTYGVLTENTDEEDW